MGKLQQCCLHFQYRKTNKTADWFDSHTEEMTLASEEKRRALAAYKACSTKQNLQALRAARSKHRTKHLIWTKFTLYRFGAKKMHTTVKSRAKIVNTAFALEFTPPCKLPCKCGIYHLCFSFPTSFDFLHHICPGWIFVNPIFRAVKVQQTARRCANDYWLKLCHQIRSAADTGNIKEMYDWY